MKKKPMTREQLERWLAFELIADDPVEDPRWYALLRVLERGWELRIRKSKGWEAEIAFVSLKKKGKKQ
jgi:hypothetical protein